MTTYYVDSANGNDAYDGTRPLPKTPSSGPWRTIGKATETVRPGDTVLVAPGTYRGPLVIQTSNTRWIALRPTWWQRFKTWAQRRPTPPQYVEIESPTLPLATLGGEHVLLRGFHLRLGAVRGEQMSQG